MVEVGTKLLPLPFSRLKGKKQSQRKRTPVCGEVGAVGAAATPGALTSDPYVFPADRGNRTEREKNIHLSFVSLRISHSAFLSAAGLW